MEGMLQPPPVTAFDASASVVSLIVYLGVALVMLARHARDARASVFFVVAATSAVPYVVSLLQWRKGAGVYTPAVIACMAAAFSIGSAALFHFTQVFPWRRPWIRAHRPWLIAAYVVPPLPVAAAAWMLGALMSALQSDAGGLGAVSAGLVEALILLGGIPAIMLVGIVLPLSGVMSLFKSWHEARTAANEPARRASFWILVSQLGGGVLAILVLPLLHFVGVPPLWSTVFAGLAYGFALTMPLAFFRWGARNDRPAP